MGQKFNPRAPIVPQSRKGIAPALNRMSTSLDFILIPFSLAISFIDVESVLFSSGSPVITNREKSQYKLWDRSKDLRNTGFGGQLIYPRKNWALVYSVRTVFHRFEDGTRIRL